MLCGRQIRLDRPPRRRGCGYEGRRIPPDPLGVPRSSTFKNYGLLQANSMGVVDYTYRGDNDQWRVPMYATRDVHIDKNTRISQFRIMKNQPPLAFTRVEHLTGPDRGGFGSTGK